MKLYQAVGDTQKHRTMRYINVWCYIISDIIRVYEYKSSMAE